MGRATYSVDYVPDPAEFYPKGRAAKKSLDGFIELDDREIYISTKSKPQNIESSLIHELLHAISEHYKIPLSEKRVRELEKALYDLFKRNGWKISVQ